MKRFLLTLIVSFALCGSMFAQYESHWADLFHPWDNNPYEDQEPLVAFIQIDGEFVSDAYDWESLEIGYFVGDACRGHDFLAYYPEEGDPYPILEAAVFYTDPGDEVTFKLFNHATGTEYDGTPNVPIITGEMHVELYFDYDEAVVLNFISPEPPTPTGFTKDIIGYGTGDGNYYLIASPVGQVNPTEVGSMLDNEFDLYYFDQSQNAAEWINYKNANFILEPGMGYLYANSEDVTLTFNGDAYDGSGEVTLAKNSDANLEGWNLVGNPFAETAYIDRPFYTMNEDGSEIMAETTTGPIEAMEGVFVIADEDGEVMAFTTTNPGKEPKIAVNLSQGRSIIDRAIVRFGEGRQLPKFQIRDNSTKVYIPVDGEDFAVVNSKGIGEIPVCFKAESNGTYSFTFASEEVSFGYLHLIDNLNGNDVDLLANPSYTFEALTSDYANRFKLVFATGNADDSFAFFSNGSFVINNDGEATLQVIDATGRILSNEQISGCTNLNVNAAPGVYMIRLVNGNNVKVQKVVVK